MNFDFTGEQQAFAEKVRHFAREHLAKDALKRAHAGGYPFDVAALMAEHGLMGISLPKSEGGQGGTLMDAVIAIMEVGGGMSAQRRRGAIRQFRPDPHFCRIRHGGAEGALARRASVRPRCDALGMTEADAGSAVTELKTSARADGAHYVINGSKVFATFSPEAQVFLIYVRFGKGLDGIGSVLVECGTPGFSVGPPQAFMSGEEWSELVFKDCRIPQQNVLLGPGGFKKQMAGFNVERLGNTARSLALGRYAFNAARDYAGKREQFGRPLCEFQGLQWKFADMAIKLDSAQLLLFRAAANADRGLPSAYETAVAKAACNQAGFEAANEAVQIMGALGYSRETLVEYCMRRTRGFLIAGGSMEMLKNRIAEHIFDRRFDQRNRPPAAVK